MQEHKRVRGVVPRVQEFRSADIQQCSNGAYLPNILLYFKGYNIDSETKTYFPKK